jgi:hypothetical protein
VAKSVNFKGDDLAQAQAIQAGMHESEKKIQQHEESWRKLMLSWKRTRRS